MRHCESGRVFLSPVYTSPSPCHVSLFLLSSLNCSDNKYNSQIQNYIRKDTHAHTHTYTHALCVYLPPIRVQSCMRSLLHKLYCASSRQVPCEWLPTNSKGKRWWRFIDASESRKIVVIFVGTHKIASIAPSAHEWLSIHVILLVIQ